MINLQNVWVLLRNDIRLSIRNWTVLFLLAMPLVLSLVMRVVLGGAPTLPTMAIIGADGSEFREVIIQSELFEVVDGRTKAEAREALEKGDLDVLLILPDDIDAQIGADSFPKVKLLVDESRQTQAAVAEHLVIELARAYAGQKIPVTLDVEPIRGITGEQGMLPNWVAMMLAMGIMILPTVFTQEKQAKTLDALMVTPLNYLDVIVGKSLYAIIVICFGAVVILGVNGGLTGNLPLLAVIILLGSACMVSIGLLIGLLVDSPETVGFVSSMVLIPVIWSAFFADFQGPVGEISKVLPGYHISQAMLHSMFAHGTFVSEWIHLVVLSGLAIVTGLACVWILSRREV